MDLTEVLYRFAKDVEAALNDNNVRPPKEEGFFGAVMALVANEKDRKQMPIGGSLNFNKEEDRWEWMPQVEQATKLETPHDIPS